MATDIEIVAEACRRIAALDGVEAVSAARVRAVLPDEVPDGRGGMRFVLRDTETVLRGIRSWRALDALGDLNGCEVAVILEEAGLNVGGGARVTLRSPEDAPGAPSGIAEAVETLRGALAGRPAIVAGVSVGESELLDPRGLLPALLTAAAMRSEMVAVELEADEGALLGYAAVSVDARSDDLRAALSPWLLQGDRETACNIDVCVRALSALLISRGNPDPADMEELSFSLALGRS